MIERKAGSIVAVSSFAGLIGVFGYGAYCPSKFAVRGLCETLRAELKPHGIHVAGVYPTDVDTPMLAGELPLQPPETRAVSGTVKPMSAESVADAILAGIATGRSRIYPGRTTKLLARVTAIAPGIADRIVDRAVARGARRNASGR